MSFLRVPGPPPTVSYVQPNVVHPQVDSCANFPQSSIPIHVQPSAVHQQVTSYANFSYLNSTNILLKPSKHFKYKKTRLPNCMFPSSRPFKLPKTKHLTCCASNSTSGLLNPSSPHSFIQSSHAQHYSFYPAFPRRPTIHNAQSFVPK